MEPAIHSASSVAYLAQVLGFIAKDRAIVPLSVREFSAPLGPSG